MSAPRYFGSHRVFEDEGPVSARRVYVDAADGWLGRRAALDVARDAGISEAAYRASLGDAHTTANALHYAALTDEGLERVVLSADFADLTARLTDARARGDWRALADALEDLYGHEIPEEDDYAEGQEA